MKRIRSIQDLEGDKFVIFKHSSICPISERAYEVISSVKGELNVPIYMVVLPEQRELSNQIAEKFHVTHQSPQVILIKGGKAVWHRSHFDITVEGLREAVAKDG